MIYILSPAKSLDFERQIPAVALTQAMYVAQASKIMDKLKKVSTSDLKHLMDISDKLAELNAARHHAWKADAEMPESRPAIFAYNGDVYDGLQAYTLNAAEIEMAQNNIRILSGLYGLLRPLDLIMPYRLEMGTELKVGTHPNLYSFWGNTLQKQLSTELEKHEEKVLINLASNEYSKAAVLAKMKHRVINPVFKEVKGNKAQIVSFFAKKARGLMARYAITNQIQRAEDLKFFNTDGYSFNAEMSNQRDWVFTRVSMKD